MEAKSLSLFQKIQDNLDEMEKCIGEIRKTHTRILTSPFHDDGDYLIVDHLMTKIQTSSTTTWKLLRAAKQNQTKDTFKKCSIRMENVQISSLGQLFIDLLAEYSAVQSSYREKRKKLLKKQLEITGQNVDEDQLDKMLEENRAVFTQDYIVEMERAREDLTDVKERYSEILKIENSLRELDDMLLSLSIIVNSQGEIIDSVEQHIVEACEDVQNGNKKIAKTAKKNRSLRKKKIALVILLLVLISVIIVLAVIFST